MSFRKRIAHFRHKRMDEGALLDVLMEIKDVSKPYELMAKQQNKATREMLRWAHVQPVQALSDFMGSMTQLEAELNDALYQYMEGYDQFCAHWREILDERKELKSLMDDHKRAEHAVEDQRKKLAAAEKAEAKLVRRGTGSPLREGSQAPSTPNNASSADDSDITEAPTPSVLKRMGSRVAAKDALDKAEEEERLLAQAVVSKQLDVQKDIHTLLRQAFYTLSATRMQLYKRSADIVEKELHLIAGLPTVSGFDDKGMYITVPFEDSPGSLVATTWHHGDMLKRTLEIERGASRLALEFEQQKKEKEMAALRNEMLEEQSQLQQKFEALDRQHTELINSLKAAAQQTEATLHDHVATLTAEKHSLTEKLRAAREAAVRGMLQTAAERVDHTAKVYDSSMANFLLLQISQTRQEMDTLKLCATGLPAAEMANNVARFAYGVELTTLAAAGTAHSLPPQLAVQCFPLAKAMTDAAKPVMAAITTCFSSEDVDAPVNIEGAAELLTAFGVELEKLNLFAQKVGGGNDLPDELSKTVSEAQQAILNAVEFLNRLKDESQASDTDRLLEVNQEVLNKGLELMRHSGTVVEAALKMKSQMEGESSTEGEASYLHQNWVRGLEACVSLLVEQIPLWLECGRQVVKNRTKFDELQVATRYIAASSAQLVASSRASYTEKGEHTKRDIETSTEALLSSSHVMTSAIRDCNNLALASVMLDDYSNLSEQQTKKLVMNTQVEILRLEDALDKERAKLGKLRRINYADTKQKRASKAAEDEI
eukprot:m.130145 g.130145  ORF g.130145 m.130145 type:complete len:770 (+) comp19969_c0_seq2:72-2381(+)